MTHPNLIVEQREAVATLTLNRPDQNNTVDAGMMAAMIDALSRLAADGARIVLLRGAGEHFCGGRDPGPTRPDDAAGWSQVLSRIVATNQALAEFPGITIALAKGRVRGFGFGLALQCDISLAADNARLSFPEIKAGFPPSVVMSYLSRWMARKKAFELVITGDEISAGEAERLGLVNRVVPSEQLDAEGQRWVDKLLQLDAAALTACKTFFRDSAFLPPDDAANYGVAFLADFNTSRSASAQ
ncbi:MAG: enoyl-CoA hydratase/isomerase family protein [Acidimicrobiia bacterium]|nr:enoyl-CoA hydratase/isomerase family protein [Acidimicrobiia bacterium]MDH3396727.1 enoyl-CoA hydratase/isomerase family protein [Acidimicrobiia bacterium]